MNCHVCKTVMCILTCCVLTGCFSSIENLAPQFPDRPWETEASADCDTSQTDEPPSMNRASCDVPIFEIPANIAVPVKYNEQWVDPHHVYDLPELIDLAQRANPDTRIAWEQTKQAAFLVGVAQSSYLPQITAAVIGGYQHTPLPVPTALFPSGFITLDTSEVLPSLVIKWLLFDFGRRDGVVEAAKQVSIASNVAFTGTHQKLIFEVSKAYFVLDATQLQLQVAKDALKNANILQDAAEAKRKSGLETVTQVAIARRETAKAKFDLERAKADYNDAYHALLEAMGLTPTLKIQVADSSGRALHKCLAENVDTYINRALARRPDIIAGLAKVRASEAEVSSAQASFRPLIEMESFVYQGIESLHMEHATSRIHKPGSAIFFKLSLPLYDGCLRRNMVNIALSKQESAKDELEKIQDQAIRQVAKAYDTVKSTLAEYESATELVKASNIAYDAALESYRRGVGTFTDAVSTETQRSQSQSTLAYAHASVLTAAAALAFSTGELTSVHALDNA